VLLKIKNIYGQFYKIPWCVPAWGWAEFFVTLNCLLTGKIKKGQSTALFEDRVKVWLGLPYAVSVNRGRTAIELALRGFEIKAFDEVILPSYVCSEVLEAVLRVGAKPVFADITSDLHLTSESISAVITANTKCVIVAHLFGRAAPIGAIEKLLESRGIYLIDDAAQSFGAKFEGRFLGAFGDCGIVSCGPGKAIASCGGGVLVTKSRELHKSFSAIQLLNESSMAITKRVLSFWLWRRFRRATLPLNIMLGRLKISTDKHPANNTFRMSNIEAAIALAQLNTLEINVIKRKLNSKKILKSLGMLAQYSISDLSSDSVSLKLVLVVPSHICSVENLIALLASSGIECQRGYTPCHKKIQQAAALQATDELWKNVICIPVEKYPDQRTLSTISKKLQGIGLC